MGQGTDSCGGYGVEYDEYEDALNTGMWIQKDGTSIHPSKMTTSHLRNTKKICEDLARSSSFSCDADKWQEWVDIFDSEIAARGELPFHIAIYTDPEMIKPVRGKKLELVCHCGKKYSPRVADLKRGFGKSCCKSCAATKRKYGRSDPKCALTGITLSEILKAQS